MAMLGGSGGGGDDRTGASTAISLHLLSCVSLVSAYFLVVKYVYGLDLVARPDQTLRLLLVLLIRFCLLTCI